MSGYPVLLEGTAVTALVVGGGGVALRKVRDLLAAGAHVRVVAPTIADELRALAERFDHLAIEQRRFRDADVREATIVFATTNDRATNARVASIARKAHRLVSVADAPDDGSFTGMATHRSGDVVIGVSAGGVPRAAARIRDAIGERFDARYATAIAALRSARRRLLAAGSRSQWRLAMQELIDDQFCARVESGRLLTEADAWR